MSLCEYDLEAKHINYTPVYFLPYMMEMEIYWVQPQLRSAESQSYHQQQQPGYWSNNSPHPVPCDAVWHRVTPVTLVTHPPPPHYTSATLQSLGVRTFLHSNTPNRQTSLKQPAKSESSVETLGRHSQDRTWHKSQQHLHEVSQKTPFYLICKLCKNKRVFLVGSKYRWSLHYLQYLSVVSTEISRPLLLSFFNLHHTSCVVVCFYFWVDTLTPEQG